MLFINWNERFASLVNAPVTEDEQSQARHAAANVRQVFQAAERIVSRIGESLDNGDTQQARELVERLSAALNEARTDLPPEG